MWYLWGKKKNMKIIARINPVNGNKWWSMMANMSSVGCAKIETYRLTFDPKYFEREVLQKPKIKNEMETENKNERTYWVIGGRNPDEKDLTYLANGGGETKSLNEAMVFECNPCLTRTDECALFSMKITEPIYKDGDILAANSGNVFIFDKYDNIEDSVYDKAFLWCHGGLSIDDTPAGSFNYISGFATESQKQRLFSALAKEGKRWNAEKKVVEDISRGKLEFSIKLDQDALDELCATYTKLSEAYNKAADSKLAMKIADMILESIKNNNSVVMDIESALKEFISNKKKSEELIEGLKNFGKGSMSAEDRFAKMIKDDYEIESYRYGDPRSVCVDSVSQPTALFKSDNLIVTYKPRRK